VQTIAYPSKTREIARQALEEAGAFYVTGTGGEKANKRNLPKADTPNFISPNASSERRSLVAALLRACKQNSS
jgi:hypothetical protein